MIGDAWPPFHFDPEHPPASHPGTIEDCSICRPRSVQFIAESMSDPNPFDDVIHTAIASAYVTADVFDTWIVPGMFGEAFRLVVAVIGASMERIIYIIATAATELDYYTAGVA